MPLIEKDFAHVYEMPASVLCKKLGLEGHLVNRRGIFVKTNNYTGKKSGKARKGFMVTITTVDKE